MAGWCVLAMGCAAINDRERIASAEPTQAAAELECMSDCLGEADASCEECATRCFSSPSGVLLTLSR